MEESKYNSEDDVEMADPQGPGSGRKKKDRNAPSRPLSGFMLFVQDKRSQLKEENPDVGFAKLGAMLGEAWNSLPEETKQRYVAMSLADRARYDEEMAIYKLSHPDEA
eukprot:GILK01011866.1.p1 GENE.GILK01011866.1~~GILK01011866.1.p1  ORF type:complete len:122 (-),score=19.70 GILK01011866.1:463-786(-)